MLKGFIDCILTHENGVHIFDFKRSVASIGSKKEILSFEKIQLWVYRFALERNFKVIQWGYINLSDGSDLLINDQQTQQGEMFNDFLAQLIESFKTEKKFHPKPRNSKVCNFCDLQLICPKEMVS